MNQTEHFALPCPSPEDYAALPLYMQRLAEQVEADNIAQQAQLNAVLKPQTVIWRAGPASFSFSTTGVEVIFLSTGDVIFSNFVPPPNQQGADSLRWSSSARPFSPGIWHVGLTVHMQEVGAVSGDSGRQILMRAFKATLGVEGAVTVAEASNVVIADATSGNGQHMTMELVFEVDQEPELFGVVASFTHANAASNMRRENTVAWITRVGGSDVIEVV